jgi:hypothetical protein
VCGQIFFGMSLIDLTQALLLGLQNKDVLARGVSSAVEGMTAREAPTPVERSMFDLLSYNYSRSAQTLVGFGVLSFNLPYNSSVRTEIKSVCAPSSRVMFRGVGVMVDTSFFLVWMGGGADNESLYHESCLHYLPLQMSLKLFYETYTVLDVHKSLRKKFYRRDHHAYRYHYL